MFVLNHEIDATEQYVDNMGFIDEMGGARFSDVAANVEKHGFRAVTRFDVARGLRDNELIIPF